MKLTFLLLICFVSITWQQNAFWSSGYPSWRMPFHSPNILAGYDPNVPLEPRRQQYQNFLPQQKTLDEGLIERSPQIPYQQRPKEDSRAFGLTGLLGINYLANLILNSFSFTSTTFVTSTSTVTAQTIVTCYDSGLFKTSSVACRRKRNSFPHKLLAGDDDALWGPQGEETATNGTTRSLKVLPKAGRDIELARVIVSSMNEQQQAAFSHKYQTGPSINRYHRQNNRRQNLQRNADMTTVTSTVTTFFLYISSSTKTISTTFVAKEQLSCLPNGFTLCPAAAAG